MAITPEDETEIRRIARDEIHRTLAYITGSEYPGQTTDTATTDQSPS